MTRAELLRAARITGAFLLMAASVIVMFTLALLGVGGNSRARRRR
jgi:hypothetical protein